MIWAVSLPLSSPLLSFSLLCSEIARAHKCAQPILTEYYLSLFSLSLCLSPLVTHPGSGWISVSLSLTHVEDASEKEKKKYAPPTPPPYPLPHALLLSGQPAAALQLVAPGATPIDPVQDREL